MCCQLRVDVGNGGVVRLQPCGLAQGDQGFVGALLPQQRQAQRVVCQLRLTSPQLVTRVHRGNLSKLLEQMDGLEIDFCLGDPRLVPKTARYDMAHIGKQMGGLYCRRGHPLARKSLVHADDIRHYGVALISISPALMEGLAVGYGFASAKDFPVAVECDDIHTLVHLTAHTNVLGLLPQAMAAATAKSLRCLQVSNALLPFADVYAIWLKGRTLSPSAKRAVALAQQIGRGLVMQSESDR